MRHLRLVGPGWERGVMVDAARKLIKQWMAEAKVNAETLAARGGPAASYYYGVMGGYPLTPGFIDRLSHSMDLTPERQVELLKAANLPVPWELVPFAVRPAGAGDHRNPNGAAPGHKAGADRGRRAR
jgi:hypothetical protein